MNTHVVPELLHPVHEGFRDLALPDAYSWDDGIIETDTKGLYVVGFRSLRNLKAPHGKIARLLELDHDAFDEAMGAPGFHTYWHDDDLSPEGLGFSFCLWDSEADAKHAAQQSKHLEAVRYARGEGKEVYTYYKVEMHTIYRFAGSAVLFDRVA